MSSSEPSEINLTEQQKRLFPEMYVGMTQKLPKHVSDLTAKEVEKLASLVKRENKELEKQAELNALREREANTFWHQTTMDNNGNIKPMPTIENLEILLNKLNMHLKYNEMTNKIEFLNAGVNVSDEFDDIYPIIMSEAVANDLPREGLQAYIPAVAKKYTYHPVKQIIDNNQWDGVTRLQEVIDCFNFTENEHGVLIMKKFFIGAIACLYDDSFFTKLVPVLHGAQSFRKTAALSRIFNITPGAWLEGHSLKESSKDSVMEGVSCWFCELGEIETTTRGEQGWLKAFLPRTFDTYRPPYGRGAVTKKRRTVFGGTVNKDDFLRDETGSTRFGVLTSYKAIDIDKLNKILGWQYKNDRVQRVDEDKLIQFWCEIKRYFDVGAGWMLSDEELKKSLVINDKYEDKGDYYEVVKDYLEELNDATGTTSEWMTSKQICDLLNIPNRLSRRVGRIFRELFKHKQGRSNVTLYNVPVYVARTIETR